VSDSLNDTAAGAAFDLSAVISRLYVYPVKSCAGVQVQDVLLTETGLEFDRAWMVVDAKGRFLTQRELPRMALIKPQLRHHDMILRAPGMLALHIALDQVEEPVRVQIWKDEVQAYDMGAIAAQWFTDFLGQTARLVRFDPEHKRVCNTDWTGGLEALNQFSDGYSILVLSEASLAQFNEKLVAAVWRPWAWSAFGPTSCWAMRRGPRGWRRMTRTASTCCRSPPSRARRSSSRSSPARAARFPTSTRRPPSAARR
jgi:hypothetical protein